MKVVVDFVVTNQNVIFRSGQWANIFLPRWAQVGVYIGSKIRNELHGTRQEVQLVVQEALNSSEWAFDSLPDCQFVSATTRKGN